MRKPQQGPVRPAAPNAPSSDGLVQASVVADFLEI